MPESNRGAVTRVAIGYQRAARLMDLLAAVRLAGGAEGLGTRQVLAGEENE